MPELVEQMYCSQQIVIPPKFPYILKRYCKAAIKTQPYDLLRWSFEYFKALAHKRPPPVKLRLEYPVYSTEGGLTRGCLKVLANQLAGMQMVPLDICKAAWRGFCLDPEELRRIFCLCEVYKRAEYVSFLQFIAVAGGMLTKSLTHTMILLCETLTKEPDGGSAAIPVHDFLIMYRFLARMDASADMKYVNGFREGWKLPVSEEIEEEEILKMDEITDVESTDDYWQEPTGNLQKLTLINDHVGRTTRLSVKLNMPLLGKIERSPSAERAGEIERKNFLMERKGRPHQNAEVNERLKQLSVAKFGSSDVHVAQEVSEMKKREEDVGGGGPEELKDHIEIKIFDEEENPVEAVFYGEPGERFGEEEDEEWTAEAIDHSVEEPVKADPSTFEAKSKMAQSKTLQSQVVMPSKMMSEVVEPVEEELTEKQKLEIYVNTCYQAREERREDLIETFDEIAAIVDKFMTAHYDLGMVAGRQMSITSGEFIVAHIEKEILEYIDDQIAILPDPDLKKKKAKPEEVAMIRELLETFLDENMDIIVPELEEVEEEEEPIPDITVIYAVPGIGGPVDEETIRVFEEYAQEACKVQADVFMPRNIRHFMCPPLEKYEEYVYDDLGPKTKKESLQQREEVPVVGKMTD